MNRILLTLVFLSALLTANAQVYEWSKSFGNTGRDEGNDIHVDDFGNTFTVGSFQGMADLNPGPGFSFKTSNGSSDIYIQKLDPLGNFVWVRAIGGTSFDEATAVTSDSLGNIYVSGIFRGTVNFEQVPNSYNLTSNGIADVFIAKFDSQGNLIWARSFGSGSSDNIQAIEVDPSGNVITAGTFSGTVDFDPDTTYANRTSVMFQDAFVHKMDAAGNYLWVKTFGGLNTDTGNGLGCDSLGNVYIGGNFRATVDFDPGPGVSNHTSLGGYNVFIVKLDSVGDYVWSRSLVGASDIQCRDLCVDNAGNVYTTGYFDGTIDFDPGVAYNGVNANFGDDAYVHKMDASGNFVWVRSWGDLLSTYSYSIAVDPMQNVYTTGVFEIATDFDPGPGVHSISPVGGADIFVHKLDSVGDFKWVRTFGSTDWDLGFGIDVDDEESVYTTGIFKSTVDFNPGTTTTNHSAIGDYDAFVHKMSACKLAQGTDVQVACNSFIWMDGNVYNSSNNTATYSYAKPDGCDTTVLLDLTIHQSYYVTDTHIACDSYSWIDGNTYTSSNSTATFTTTTINGCDSVITLDLTINSISDLTTSLNGFSILANNSAATYQWLDCDNNYAMIPGETNQLFKATANGNYAVQISENGCIDTSACVAITSIGLVENGFGAELSVFPNPSNGDFTVDLGQSLNQISILITDLSGRTLETKDYSNTDILEFTLSQPAGVYLLTLQSGDKQAVVRLVKN